MRKTILYCLLAWTASVPALALTVPDGQAAIVDTVIGKARADQGQGFKALTLGEALAPGSTIKTGANGRVALTLPDGSSARIAANTEMTLKDEKKRKGIFTRLVLGTVRFLVMKQGKDSVFETEMPNAVAAVKGTDPEYHTDGTISTAKVFSSGNPVALVLTDGAGHTQDLKAGEKLSFDGTSFKVEPLTDADTKESDGRYKGLSVPIEDDSKKKDHDPAAPAAGATPGPSGSTGAGDTDKDSADALKEATDQAMQEATRDLYLDGFLTRDERTGDIAAGKLVYDRFGQQVQVSHFITEPDPQTVQISSFSSRDAGPNKGVTSAIETSSWNQTLPDNWGKVFATKLSDASNLDSNGYPIFWKTSETFLAKNPYGDSLQINTQLDSPVWFQTQDPSTLDQGRTQAVVVNSQQVFSYGVQYLCCDGQNLAYSQSYQADTGNGWYSQATAYQGGTQFNLQDGSSPVVLTTNLHLIDDNGNVLANPNFISSSSLPNSYRGLNANVELALSSPLMNGRSIDLVFLPGFYDLYDVLQLPTFNYAP